MKVIHIVYVFILTLFVCGTNSKFPMDFDDSAFYLTSRKGGPPSEVIEDIRRGQEGVLVKLRQVTDELESDELKLNNIFYKLGHHDTELKSVTNGLSRMTALGRKTESKLNKHSFNVEFLHQQVQELKTRMNNQAVAQEKILSLQKMVIHLEERLSETNLKLSMQNRTSNGGINVLRPLEAAPITYVQYPLNDNGVCLKNWKAYDGACYFVSKVKRSFRLAIASCAEIGGSLLSLTEEKSLALMKLFENDGEQFWTSATDILSPQQWNFLLSGRMVQHTFFANHYKIHLLSMQGNHCGVWTSKGLIPINCGLRKPYICERLA